MSHLCIRLSTITSRARSLQLATQAFTCAPKTRAFTSVTANMQTVKDKIAQNFGGKAQEMGRSQFSLEEVPNLEGKVAVVTGGSEGIGYGVTHTLLSKGISKLFITSLKEATGRDALEALEDELGADRRNRVVYIQTDQSDWKEAAKVGKEIASQTDRIDIVVLNAARGIMTTQKAETNGTDLHLAINHVGHAVFLSNLLPVIKKTADSGSTVRIAALSSNLHESAPSETEFKTVDEWNKDYGPNAQYGRAKLANFLYVKWLDTHLHSKHQNILINATHPGIVDTAQTTTHIHEAYPLLGYGMSAVMKPFQKTQFEGAVSTLYASTVVTQSGLYITPPCIVEKGSDKANDPEIAENLMKLTKQLVDEKAGPGVLQPVE